MNVACARISPCCRCALGGRKLKWTNHTDLIWHYPQGVVSFNQTNIFGAILLLNPRSSQERRVGNRKYLAILQSRIYSQLRREKPEKAFASVCHSRLNPTVNHPSDSTESIITTTSVFISLLTWNATHPKQPLGQRANSLKEDIFFTYFPLEPVLLSLWFHCSISENKVLSLCKTTILFSYQHN